MRVDAKCRHQGRQRRLPIRLDGQPSRATIAWDGITSANAESWPLLPLETDRTRGGSHVEEELGSYGFWAARCRRSCGARSVLPPSGGGRGCRHDRRCAESRAVSHGPGRRQGRPAQEPGSSDAAPERPGSAVRPTQASMPGSRTTRSSLHSETRPSARPWPALQWRVSSTVRRPRISLPAPFAA
jgi:hypothetical protein